MKKHLTYTLLLAMVLASCSNDLDPADQPDFSIIPTYTTIDINGVIEHNGEVSIFGENRNPSRFISWSVPTTCLEINDFMQPIPEDNGAAVYSTLSSDGRTWTDNDTFVSNIHDIYFLDDQTAYMQTQLQGLFKTTDGGSSWQQILKPSVNYYCNGRYALRFEEVFFKNDMEGYVIDHDGNSNDFILQTMDGGESWSTLYPTDSDFMSGQLRSVKDLYFVPNSQVAYWKIGNYGGYRKSIDGGITWDVQAEETGAQDIQFLNANVGFYLQNDAVFKTVDGGQTWNHTAPDTPAWYPDGIYGLSGSPLLTVVDENRILVSAASGGNDVFESTDGGRTFSPLKVPDNQFITDIYVAPSGKIYLYGQRGSLLVSK